MINPWRWRPRVMKQNQKRNAKGRAAKSVLWLPDLEVAKSAVLNSLSCADAQRGYRHAINEFVDWYRSEPRLSFSKTVVLGTECIWNSKDAAVPEVGDSPLRGERSANCPYLNSR
jgi:hypothetical protein